MKPFDNVRKLLKEEEVQIHNPFMVNRILSFLPSHCLASIDVGKYIGKLPSWAIDSLFNVCFKKMAKVPYIKFLKKQRKRSPKAMGQISDIFGVNDYHAEQIFEIFKRSNDDIHKHLGLKEGE